MNDKLEIRIANMSDADSILTLSYELGYQPTLEEIQNRITSFSSRSDQQIYVAELNNVVGWIHISRVDPLESNPFGEIRGVIVKDEFRGKGIGTKLIESSINWAKSKECNRVRIRTNIKRVETVKYYKKLGLTSKKTQEVFEKTI